MEKWNKFKAWLEKYIVAFSIGIGLGSLAFILIGFGVTGHLFKNDFDYNYLSAFGDFLSGFLGAAFGMITIYLVYKTFKSQKEELHDQKQLLADQQEELRLTRASQEKQNFENTFFRMLEQNRAVLGQLNSNGKAGLELVEYHTRKIATKFWGSYKNHKDDNVKNIEYLELSINESLFIREYSSYHNYFMNILQTSTYISKANLSKNDKKIYFMILENSLSLYEKLLFYCLKIWIFNKDLIVDNLKTQFITFRENIDYIDKETEKHFYELELIAWKNSSPSIF